METFDFFQFGKQVPEICARNSVQDTSIIHNISTLWGAIAEKVELRGACLLLRKEEKRRRRRGELESSGQSEGSEAFTCDREDP